MIVGMAMLMILTITGCNTTPTTPRLAEPKPPDFSHLTFTDADIKAILACINSPVDQTACTVPRHAITTYDDLLLRYKGYARECIAVIRHNNQQAR